MNQFEKNLTEILNKHQDTLKDRKSFKAILRDYFPTEPLIVNALLAAHEIDLHIEIRKSEIDHFFASRFVDRIEKEYGMSKEIATKSVETWIACSDNNIILKKNSKELNASLDEDTFELYATTEKNVTFNYGYLSGYFVNDADNMSVELDEPLILITQKTLSTKGDISFFINLSIEQNQSLLIVANEIYGEALTALVEANMRGEVRCAAVKVPCFNDNHKYLISELAKLAGAKLFNEEIYLIKKDALEYLGGANKVVITKYSTKIIDGFGNKDDFLLNLNLNPNIFKYAASAIDVNRLKDTIMQYDLYSSVKNGVQFAHGYLPEKFDDIINDSIELDNPLILLITGKFQYNNEIISVIDTAIDASRNLLIIAENVGDEVLDALVHANEVSCAYGIQFIAVNVPGVNANRFDLLQDLSILTGNIVFGHEISLKTYCTEIDDLGSADKVIITKDNTIILFGPLYKHDLSSYLWQLKVHMNNIIDPTCYIREMTRYVQFKQVIENIDYEN